VSKSVSERGGATTIEIINRTKMHGWKQKTENNTIRRSRGDPLVAGIFQCCGKRTRETGPGGPEGEGVKFFWQREGPSGYREIYKDGKKRVAVVLGMG